MSKILSDEDGDTIWNDPTPNIDDEIEKLEEILLTYGGYCSQQVEATDGDEQFIIAAQAIKQLITDARVDELENLKINCAVEFFDPPTNTGEYINYRIKELKENK